MAQYGSKDLAFVLVDGYDITLLLPGGMDVPDISAVLDKVNSFSETFCRYADSGSREMSSMKLMALYDDAAGATRDVFVEKQGIRRTIVWCVSGNTVGKRFEGYVGQIGQKVTRIASDGKLHRANIEYAGTGAREEGIVLQPLAALTANGNTQATSHDWSTDVRARNAAIATSSVANPTTITTTGPHGLTSAQKVVIAGHTGSTPAVSGEYTATVVNATQFTVPVNVSSGGTGGTVTHADSLGGGSGYIACSALTLGGYTNIIGKISHSVDNSAFVDLITFTAITAAPAAERKTVTGTINRYLATSRAYTGSGSAPSATIFMGFKRATDE